MENQVLVIGSTCVDVIIRVDHLPHTEENLHPDGQQFAIGGCAYNAANPSTYCSVREMAEMVASLAPDGSVQVRCAIDPDAPYPPEHHLPLDVSRLQALGWAATQDLPGMYRNLMAYLED